MLAKQRTKKNKSSLTTLVKFGGITIVVPKPTKKEYKRRVEEGNKALGKLAKILSKPGVELNHGPQIPIYVAYSKERSLVVQTLNGISRVGKFDKAGRFLEIKTNEQKTNTKRSGNRPAR